MTVQSLVLSLALRVDPFRRDTGVPFTSATIGTTDGGRFTAQRLLDIYNEARLSLFSNMKLILPYKDLQKLLGGIVVVNNAFTFSGGSATLPSDFIREIGLMDSTGQPIYFINSTTQQIAQEASNPHFIQSATNRFVYRTGNTLKSTAGLPNASNYILHYFGMGVYTLTDVTNGTTQEGINSDYYFAVLEIAEAIADEQGIGNINKLAKTLIEQRTS